MSRKKHKPEELVAKLRQFAVSERRVCAAKSFGQRSQHRSTQRKTPRGRDDEARLTADIVELARRYGSYGYQRITALLRTAGRLVNAMRVERIWRSEGLKVPARQPKKGRLWLDDGSCIRLRAEHRDYVWANEFVEDRTRDGRKLRMLNVVDEFTREYLAISVTRKLEAIDVLPTCSSRGAFRITFAPTTVRSSLPRSYRIGSLRSAQRRHTSPRVIRGRMARRIIQCSALR